MSHNENKNNFDDLIGSLSSDLQPTKMVEYKKYMFFWIAFCLCFLGAMVLKTLFKVDSGFQLSELISFNFVLSLMIFALSGFATFHSIIPHHNIRKMSLVSILLYCMLLLINLLEIGSFSEFLNHVQPLKCINVLIGLGVLPLVLGTLFLKKGKTVQMLWTGINLALASYGIASMILGVICPVKGAVHVLFTHIYPIVFLMIGVGLASRKILKW